jgi:hypothetical protein
MLRSALPAATLRVSIADAVRETDPSPPIIRWRNVFRNSVRRPRALMQLLAGFAGLALLLAAVGTYGVLSHMSHSSGVKSRFGDTLPSMTARVE